MERDYWNIFDELDDKQNTLDGVISLIGALEEAINYGTSEKEDLIDGVILLRKILQQYNKDMKVRIEEGFEMVKQDRTITNDMSKK